MFHLAIEIKNTLMKYFADFHLHSHYSRATSKNLNLETLYQWAKIKGINVIGTGDFTHPEWIKEIENKLEPEGNGLFRLKNPPKDGGLLNIKTKENEVRFCLSTEISSIYKHGEKVRKNHNIVLAPDFETAKKLNARLSEIGNLASDGRPILGLPARDLLEIVLESSDDAHLIPAHVWTPWFSTLGSKAGYDSIEDCFRDLSEHIFALETGLSSDPMMNWKLSSLDKYSLVSNSDAHSPQKLGREANIFDTDLSYFAMFEALKSKKGFLGTYEFFPEEGKYHMDGHRKCNIALEPEDSIQLNNICPVCGKPLTIGVLHRVEKLADRKTAQKPKDSPGFEYIIPLPEIIAEISGTAPTTKTVQQAYIKTISEFGNEYDILHKVPIEDIKSKSGIILSEAIRRLRGHEVNPIGGYDGEFGVIQIFNPGEIEKLVGQTDIFGGSMIDKMVKRKTKKQSMQSASAGDTKVILIQEANDEQIQAINSEDNVQVIAGPGTGKTYTLVQWIIHQIKENGVNPEKIIAITFTNKAADELKSRLIKEIGIKAMNVVVGTFHSIAYKFLKSIKPELETIYDQNNRKNIFKILFPQLDNSLIKKLSSQFERHLELLESTDEEFKPLIDEYQSYLTNNNAVDLSSIIWNINEHLRSGNSEFIKNIKCIAVDEFQDINPVQYDFIKLISIEKHVFIIGDPNQSIYSFRGSKTELFFSAEKDLYANKIYLTTNYRTPGSILNPANELIANNYQETNYKLKALKNTNFLIKHFTADDAKQEASFIAEQALNYVGGVDSMSTGVAKSDYNYAFSDIAILYRTHHVGNEISKQLKTRGIPVLHSDGTSYLSEQPFDIIYYSLQLLNNSKNIVALSGLIDRLSQIGETKKQSLLKKYINDELQIDELSEDENWRNWIKIFSQIKKEEKLERIILLLLDAFIPVSILTEQEQFKREGLIKLADEFNDRPNEFLHKYILSPYTDAGRLNSGGVRLLTFHAAKGLEFPVTIIAGAEEGITPIDRKTVDLEEERRLFYVAMTRAKDELIITNSKSRIIYGLEKEMAPSRFLGEFDKKFIQRIEFETKTKFKSQDKQLSLF